MSKEKQILQYCGDGRSQRQTAADGRFPGSFAQHRFIGDCSRHTRGNYSAGGSLYG